MYTGTQAGRHLAVPCPASLPVPYAELGASTDGSLVLICDVQGQSAQYDLAYVSTDGGSSWTAITAPPVWSDGVTAITGKRFSWNRNVLVSSGEPGRSPWRGRRVAPEPLHKLTAGAAAGLTAPSITENGAGVGVICNAG